MIKKSEIQKSPILIELALLTAVLVIAHFVFLYVDLTNTVDNANILLYAIKNGRFTEFYELSVEKSVTNYSANYSIVIYLLFAIWQAPVRVLFHLGRRQYLASEWAMLWSKTLPLLFAGICAVMIYKIVMLCANNRKQACLAVFLFFSSMAVFYPVFICGQLDSISTALMLAGIYYYLSDRFFFFWIFFCLAAPFKFFALILALPLILIKEKNLVRASGCWLALNLFPFLERILFRNSVIYKAALGAQTRDAIDQILRNSIFISKSVTWFLLLYMALLIFLYIQPVPIDKKEQVLYICLLVWESFLLFSSINPYWILLSAPFLALCISLKQECLHMNILLETAGLFSFFLYLLSRGGNCFSDVEVVHRLFLASVYDLPGQEVRKYANVYRAVLNLGLDRYSAVFLTVFTVAMLAILILTVPSGKVSIKVDLPGDLILFCRPLLLGLASLLIVIPFLIRSNPIGYDTRGADKTACNADLTSSDERNVVSQTVSFREERDLDQLVLALKNTSYHRSNMSSLIIEIEDEETQEIIFRDTVVCCMIEDGNDLYIDLQDTHVEAEKEYTVRLSGKPGIQFNDQRERLYPYLSNANPGGLDQVRINGRPGEGILCFMIR